MKKILNRVFLILGLMGSGHVNAFDANAAMQGLQLAQETMSATANGAIKIAAQTSAAIDEWVKNSAWAQQAKDMYESLTKLQTQINELMGLRDDFMNTLSGSRNLQGSVVNKNTGSGVDYAYAEKTPQEYLNKMNIACSNGATKCTVSGSGYTGVINSGESSTQIRDSWNADLSGGLTSRNINEISYREAEKNAQAIAIIQAMAQEAYAQANLRIKEIEKLEQKIAGITSGANTKSGGGAADNSKNNDLKYIADLQAQIQVQNALLANEQNKLASLAILQQSQRDAYEQRKKEIAAYAVRGGDDGGLSMGGIVTRSLVGTAQAAAYGAVVAAYQ